ncbi:hypothetical protein [Pararhodobacter sp. SW119]|uniref:hypothetical protein n=1 Tax=Pararhodobacter sp. SW119 TaxID=2780075 RepID=UPI001AE08A70|nr:hypothetical protein [Pararhodobacter sp. SW119]
MAEAGITIDEIATYLGHTNPNITRKTSARTISATLPAPWSSGVFRFNEPESRPKKVS